jgi:hypothetical protein
MNVNQKGSIGLIEVIRDLTKKGYECFTPLHDYSAVDLIIMNKEFQMKRIQIKYREFTSNTATVEFCSVVNGKRIPIDLSAIDGWAVYLPEVETVCYVSKSMIEEGTKSFRIRKIEGNTTINIDRKPAPLYTNIINEAVFW